MALSARTQGFEVCLIEPGQAFPPAGARPKTDVLDAPWLQCLAPPTACCRDRSGPLMW